MRSWYLGKAPTSRKLKKTGHNRRFIALMEHCHQRQIKLNTSKLQFKLKEVKFMGRIISDKVMRPDPDKVEAITQMPTPKNKAALL